MTDPLEIRVYPGSDAAFTLYEDDGDNYDYERQIASRILLRWDEQTRTLTVLPGVGARKEVTYTGEAVQVVF